MERKLTDQLPERYLNSPEVGAAAGILWVLGEAFRDCVLDWLEQLTIDTATWGLKYWEQAYGVTPQITDTVEERRSRVKAKMRGAKTTTREMLAGVAAAYAVGATSSVEELAREHRVRFHFSAASAFPSSMEALTVSLLEVMPSHVVFDYLFSYRQEQPAAVHTAAGTLLHIRFTAGGMM